MPRQALQIDRGRECRLQFDFVLPAITALPQTMSSRQFPYRTFDARAGMHFFDKPGAGLLFAASSQL